MFEQIVTIPENCTAYVLEITAYTSGKRVNQIISLVGDER